jgi:predicted transcriptional regulator
MKVMKLNDFLSAEGISMGAFAKTVGTTTATISRVSDGTVVPRKALMERIHDATGGLVTPNDLVGLPRIETKVVDATKQSVAMEVIKDE